MLDNGIDSSIVAYQTPRAQSERLIRFSGLAKFLRIYAYGLIHKYIRSKIVKNKNLFSFPFVIGNDISKHPALAGADVIYLHWINGGFLSLRNIRQIASMGKPLVFFMHDMWTITGGCHHSFECQGYKSACEYCPMFGGKKKETYASITFREKKKLFSDLSNVYFVSPSKWLADCASESRLTSGKPIVRLPNVISEKLFKPFDRSVAKSILNVDPDCKTISFGCVAGLKNPIKGWNYLKDALNIIRRENEHLKIQVLIFGSDYEPGIEATLPYPVKFLGQINDEVSMVVLNNATDLFVSPSLAESFGMTSMENIMCKTPVVIFDVGGSVDFVEHKRNGYLAKYKSSDDLAEGIVYCLENSLPVTRAADFQTDTIIGLHKNLVERISSLTFSKRD